MTIIILKKDNKMFNKYSSILPSLDTIQYLKFILSLSKALLSHRPRNIDFNLDITNNEIRINSKENLFLAKETIKSLTTYKDIKIIF